MKAGVLILIAAAVVYLLTTAGGMRNRGAQDVESTSGSRKSSAGDVREELAKGSQKEGVKRLSPAEALARFEEFLAAWERNELDPFSAELQELEEVSMSLGLQDARRLAIEQKAAGAATFVLQNLFERWAQLEPEGAWQALGENPTTDLAASVLTGWANAEPRAAMAAYLEIRELRELSQEVVSSLMEFLVAVDPAAAWQQLLELKSYERGAGALGYFRGLPAGTDFAAEAIRLPALLPSELDVLELHNEVLSEKALAERWAREDLPAAVDWYAELEDEAQRTDRTVSILLSLLVTQPDDVSSWLQAVSLDESSDSLVSQLLLRSRPREARIVLPQVRSEMDRFAYVKMISETFNPKRDPSHSVIDLGPNDPAEIAKLLPAARLSEEHEELIRSWLRHAMGGEEAKAE